MATDPRPDAPAANCPHCGKDAVGELTGRCLVCGHEPSSSEPVTDATKSDLGRTPTLEEATSLVTYRVCSRIDQPPQELR